MLRTLVRRSQEVPFNVYSNPYKAKKTWPPDFTKLSAKHQFRLERRYRRRSKLKWARPRWNKLVKLTTWGSIVFVAFYGLIYMEVGKEGSPFDGIRAWYKRATDAIWTGGTNQPIPERHQDQQSPIQQR